MRFAEGVRFEVLEFGRSRPPPCEPPGYTVNGVAACARGELSNIIYFMHPVLVIMDVSCVRYQIVTLKSFVLLGGRACDACEVRVFCDHFCLNTFPS